MSTSSSLFDPERRWHDPAFVAQWKYVRSRAEAASQLMSFPGESLAQRAKRLDGSSSRSGEQNARAAYRPPSLIAKQGDQWSLHPWAASASSEKLDKVKALYDFGLPAKAQRELGCGVLGGKVRCKNAHEFRVSYRCGHRYCLQCGPHTAIKLFAKHLPRVKAVTDALLGSHPNYVLAKIDFTRRKPCGHRGRCSCSMPDADYNRELNVFIRRLARAIERRFGITREQYALAVHDEIGGGNTNAHAHAVYVGPYLCQKWLSATWRKICKDGSFIVSIKRAKDVAQALWHATKYPAKFIQASTPERLAQLEKSYHRVRRFRLLGAFDKRVAERIIAASRQGEEAVADDLDSILGASSKTNRCPYCESPLHRVGGWCSLEELSGLPDLDEVKRDMARQRILCTQGRDG